MNEAEFLENFISGRHEKGAGYRYFVPNPINKSWTWSDNQLSSLLESASIRLGELNAYARLVPDIDLFIQLHVTKEAVISSRIEGTRTQMDEALLPEEDISPERRNDWQEVQNYTHALNSAIKKLQDLPLSSRLLRFAHELLLQGVRGEAKLPGEYRRSQNWIGGVSLTDALFIPPSHIYVEELMGDLENFLHNEDIHVPSLIRIGMAHYQFETIHPFLDGNGRVGRLLITLYLVAEKILERPLLYLSVFFERNKGIYYDNLTRVREKSDMVHWLKYFLIGVKETARQATQTLSNIIQMKSILEAEIRQTMGKRSYQGLQLLDYLFKHPIVSAKNVEVAMEVSKKSAYALVDKFIEMGVLHEASGQSRHRVFRFQEYLQLFGK